MIAEGIDPDSIREMIAPDPDGRVVTIVTERGEVIVSSTDGRLTGRYV